jgi:Undecaprenyl-phosphate galactose phosphotransferase WbaP
MSLALLAGDVLGLLLVGAIGGAVGLLSGGAASLWASGFAVPVGGGGTLALLAAYAVTGLYSHPLVHPAEEMHRLATVTAGMGGVAGAALFIGGGPLTVSVLVAGVGGVGACVIPLTRGLVRVLCAQTTWWGIPTLVLGSDRLGASVVDTLSRWPEIGLRPVARLTDGASLADRPGTASVPIVGRIQEAPVLARRYRIPHAVFALPALSHAERAKRIATYSKFFDHVLVLADMGDWPALWASGGMGKGLVGYNVRHYALQPAARLVKRTLDLVGALCALVLLAPVFAVIAALIKADDPGPVLYRQHRMGRDGRVFTVLKFRTMYTDAHRKLQAILDSDPRRRREYERYHKLKDDPRVTTIGRVLRASSLDELPQLLNVLKGEMSLVGPRAYMPGELPKMNGLSRAVLQTPPGITGLWQVSGRNRLSFDARVDLDVHYIQNWSPWLDLYILVRTIPVVLTGDGAC